MTGGVTTVSLITGVTLVSDFEQPLFNVTIENKKKTKDKHVRGNSTFLLLGSGIGSNYSIKIINT
jgi:hypothetical protein